MPQKGLLSQLVGTLEGGSGNNGQKRSSKNSRRRKRNRSKGDRGGKSLQRNPGRRGDVSLSLTRSQFTATSPLNLFQVVPASTPGGIRVRGRELISSVNLSADSTGAFQLLDFGNVGQTFMNVNPLSFPRLQAYAPIYEMYKFHRAQLLFQSNQPTTRAGEILMCVDYDAGDTAPANAVAMMRNISSTMANIYSDASLSVEASLSRLPKFYTDQKAGVAESSQQFQAKAYLAVEGITGSDGDSVGYLIVQYDVEFFTPQ